MEHERVGMQYQNETQLAADCVIAATGTLLDDNYKARSFEHLIGTENSFQRVCSYFIEYVKNSENTAYVSKENFNEYFLTKKDSDTLLDSEHTVINSIFDQIQYNKDNNNQGLKSPEELWKKLESARKKINLKKEIDKISVLELFEQPAATWTDKFADELSVKLSDTATSFTTVGQESKIFFGPDLPQYYAQILDEREKGEVYSFHFPLFDKLFTEGPTPGHGGLIGGSTGMGKSALCLNCINGLIDADVPTMYFPIEMGVVNTMDRLASIRTRIPFKDIIKIGKSEAVQGAREVIEQEISSLRMRDNFAIVDDANLDMKKLKSYIQRFQARLPGRKYCIVFIDLLLMIKEFYDDGSNMAQMIERAINKLDILSKELGFHYVGVVQLNRTVEQDKVTSVQSIDKLKPSRAAIKNSNALLERARYCFTVFRKRAYAEAYLEPEEYETMDDVMEISLLKANDDKMGKTFANYDGPTFTISPILQEDVASVMINV